MGNGNQNKGKKNEGNTSRMDGAGMATSPPASKWHPASKWQAQTYMDKSSANLVALSIEARKKKDVSGVHSCCLVHSFVFRFLCYCVWRNCSAPLLTTFSILDQFDPP